jgi:hypothetical protein
MKTISSREVQNSFGAFMDERVFCNAIAKQKMQCAELQSSKIEFVASFNFPHFLYLSLFACL